MSTHSPNPKSAKPARQKRSRDTRDKLIGAVESLLREKNFAAITVTEVAERAGVSPASIYRRFDKKDGFLPVLFELYEQRLEEWKASPEARIAISRLNLREALRKITETAWHQLESQAHIMRAIHTYGREKQPELTKKLREFEEISLQTMEMVINYYKQDIRRTNHRRAARMLAYYFNSALLERGLFASNQTDIDTESFLNDIADFAYGYLVTRETH